MSEINLSDVLQTDGAIMEVELSVETDRLSEKESLCRITEAEPLVLKVYNQEKGKAVLRGKTTVHTELPCDRCLKPVKTRIEIAFEREILAPELLEEDPDQAEDQTFVEGYVLIPEKLLQEEIVINLPVKVLCKEDCKGICRMCGHDLNEGDCGCDTFVPDPRMAVIADLFK